MSSNNAKINLTPLTSEDLGGRRGVKAITLDKQGRLSLSSALRRELGIAGRPAHIFVSIDLAQRVIGIVKHDAVTSVVNAAQVKIDKRGYTSGKALLDKFGLAQKSGPYKFDYVGKLDSAGADWHAFRLRSAKP